MPLQLTWSLEQILGLAPDRFIAKSSRALALPQKWANLQHAHNLIWGDFPQYNRPPMHVAVDLNGPAFTCSCRSRKTPCRHSLALIQVGLLYPDEVSPAEPPAWVARWLKRTQKPRTRRHSSPASQEAVETAEERERLQLLRQGMGELATWLEDLVREGLSSAPERPAAGWKRMSARLVDAQAGLLAMRIDELQKMVSKTKGVSEQWPEPFLRECGQIYLLAHSFRRYDELSPAQQCDLRTAVGWLPKTFHQEVVEGQWQVIGRGTTQIGRNFYYRTWLWSLTHQRPALVTRATHSRLSGASVMTTGDIFDGQMGYAPGGIPLQAEQLSRASQSSPLRAVPRGRSIAAEMAAFQQARQANPWLTRYPFLLAAVWPEAVGEQWFLVDPDHAALPFNADPTTIWHLLADSGGQPLTLFGEWDGSGFAPLTLRRSGRWLDMHALGGALQ